MDTMKGNNITTIYKKLFNKVMSSDEILYKGEKQIKSCRDIIVELSDITSPIIDERVDKKYLFGELDWFLNGTYNIETVREFSKVWYKCINGYANSNYGKIVFRENPNQIKFVIDELTKFRDSRRCFININGSRHKFDNDTNKCDFPCTIGLHLLPRDGKYLDCYVYMRSNDLVYGFPYNVTFFIAIQTYVIKKMGFQIKGSKYVHISPDIHIYKKHYNMHDSVKSFKHHPEIGEKIFDEYLSKMTKRIEETL